MIVLKLRKLWNSMDRSLLREPVDRRSARDGARCSLAETPDSYGVGPHDPEFVKQAEIAEEGMRAYRGTLGALAK